MAHLSSHAPPQPTAQTDASSDASRKAAELRRAQLLKQKRDLERDLNLIELYLEDPEQPPLIPAAGGYHLSPIERTELLEDAFNQLPAGAPILDLLARHLLAPEPGARQRLELLLRSWLTVFARDQRQLKGDRRREALAPGASRHLLRNKAIIRQLIALRRLTRHCRPPHAKTNPQTKQSKGE